MNELQCKELNELKYNKHSKYHPYIAYNGYQFDEKLCCQMTNNLLYLNKLVRPLIYIR